MKIRGGTEDDSYNNNNCKISDPTAESVAEVAATIMATTIESLVEPWRQHQQANKNNCKINKGCRRISGNCSRRSKVIEMRDRFKLGLYSLGLNVIETGTYLHFLVIRFKYFTLKHYKILKKRVVGLANILYVFTIYFVNTKSTRNLVQVLICDTKLTRNLQNYLLQMGFDRWVWTNLRVCKYH